MRSKNIRFATLRSFNQHNTYAISQKSASHTHAFVRRSLKINEFN